MMSENVSFYLFVDDTFGGEVESVDYFFVEDVLVESDVLDGLCLVEE